MSGLAWNEIDCHAFAAMLLLLTGSLHFDYLQVFQYFPDGWILGNLMLLFPAREVRLVLSTCDQSVRNVSSCTFMVDHTLFLTLRIA